MAAANDALAPMGKPDLETFLRWIGDADAVRGWLSSLGVRDPIRGAKDFADLIQRGGVGAGLSLAVLLGRLLPRCPDPGMALTNLDRFVASHPYPAAAFAVLELDPKTTEILLQFFSTSQHFSEALIRSPDALPWLRGGAERWDRSALIRRLWEELAQAPNDAERMRGLRRFRQREMLRIGYNDIARGWPLDVITLDLSHLADACVSAAHRWAYDVAVSRYGKPMTGSSPAAEARFAVLALGKLGGEELNYSSDIDLIFLYDEDGQTQGPRVVSNAEFFARMGADLVRMLSDRAGGGESYRVDMRLRPQGDQGPLALSLAATIGYYETVGRVWERQALIKCRPIAGDEALGRQFLAAITPFVYHRYLSSAEIGEIRAMKRRIEQRTQSAGADQWEVKTGRGGIRDVEFVVQFLQLLHGGQDESVRDNNTLRAMAKLRAAGCLRAEEHQTLEETYIFLRTIEHRLQTMFDRQTHEMPRDPEGLRVLALRMSSRYQHQGQNQPPIPIPIPSPGLSPNGDADAGSRFLEDYRAKTELNRRILKHLLHDAFPREREPVHPAVDLVLNPEGSTAEQIEAAFRDYPLRDRKKAYANLLALAREDIPFLSQARCRHFLASIAPQLLEAVSRTADPDRSLTNLEKVSASLGAKAVLWELFSAHPPSLRLYVEVCATSPFLSEVLINNPGMIDDLIDSLVDDRPRSREEIRGELAGLCANAEDLAPILLGFRNKEWVRIGARDILGREPIRIVTRQLSDVAQAIVAEAANDQTRRRGAEEFPWAIVALGKWGGREISYHSDLDLIFLYDERSEPPAKAESLCASLALGTLKALESSTARTRLYHMDLRLRPYGNDGQLVSSLASFVAYHEGKGCCGRLWEALALTRARVVFGPPEFADRVESSIRRILTKPADPSELGRTLLELRAKETETGKVEIKRSAHDIEFLVQFLQRVHGAVRPDLLEPNLWDALDALASAGLITEATRAELVEAYDFFRSTQSRLRLLLPPDDSAGSTANRLDQSRFADIARERFFEVVTPVSPQSRPEFDGMKRNLTP